MGSVLGAPDAVDGITWKVWRSPIHGLGSWLASTARNECLRYVTARKRIVLVDENDDLALGRLDPDRAPVLGEDARDLAILDDLYPTHAGTLGQRHRGVGRVALAVMGKEDRADQVRDVHQRIFLGDLLRRDRLRLDAEGAVWYGDVPNKRCVRVRAGGEVLQTIDLDRVCFACMLGGAHRKTLFMVAREWRGLENMAGGSRTGQVLFVEAPTPGAGWP